MSWGIEIPERPNIVQRLGDKLSPEQQSKLQQLIDELKAQETDPKRNSKGRPREIGSMGH